MMYQNNNMPPKQAIRGPVESPPKYRHNAFSPEFSVLLALTLKDGFCNKTAFSLLRDAYPYVSNHDQEKILRLLTYNNMVNQVTNAPQSVYTYKNIQTNRPLTSKERLLRLLSVLKRYGGMQSQRIFQNMQRSIQLNDNISHVVDQFTGHSRSNVYDILSTLNGYVPGRDVTNLSHAPEMMEMVHLLNNTNNNQDNMESIQSMLEHKPLHRENPERIHSETPPAEGNGMGNMANMMNMMNMLGGGKGGAPGGMGNLAGIMSMMNMLSGGKGGAPGGMGNLANMMNMMNMMNGNSGSAGGDDDLSDIMNLFEDNGSSDHKDE